MSPKQILMASTIAIAITISSVMWNDETSTSSLMSPMDKSDTYNKSEESNLSLYHTSAKEDLIEVLGVTSDEDIYDALFEGKSLADIAIDNQMDIKQVINLQTAELTEQLDLRLASGSISPEVYEAQKSELTAIITHSVYGKNYS